MTIFNALPGIIPSARSCTMGQWPQRRVKMRNGRTVRLPLSSKPSGDSIELEWPNVTYQQAEELCIVWDDNYGTYGQLSQQPNFPLTQELLAGMSSELKQLLTLPITGATWHFIGKPSVESVKPGRCTVRMRIGLRASVTYSP